MKHPLQNIYIDENGTARFQENKIVKFLLDAGPYDLDELVFMNFSQEEWEQFAQLIGYSICGFEELSYVSDELCEKAKEIADGLVALGKTMLVCDSCKKAKADVKEVVDPYVREVCNKEVERLLCDDCYQKAVEAI